MSTQALETIKSQPVAMVTERIITKSGKDVGERVKFAGATAKEIKKWCRDAGMKKAATRKETAALLTGRKDFAIGAGQLFFTAQVQQGKIPVLGESRDESGLLRFVLLETEKTKSAKEVIASLTDEERAAYFDELLAQQNAKDEAAAQKGAIAA